MPQAIYMQKDQDQDLENLIIISKHYSNIYRLINKSETKIKF